MKKVAALLLCIILGMGLLTGCQKGIDQFAKLKKGEQVAEISVRGYGSIYVRFFKKAAPKAVENFITHAEKGYYDEVPFYKIIKNSLIEGGDPTGTGEGGESIWGEYFKDEFDPDLQPYYGALCMANIGPDTNTSRFFIVQADKAYNQKVLSQIEQSYDIKFNKKAQKRYGKIGGAPRFYEVNTVFGQVYKGYNVLDHIARVKKVNAEQGIPADKVMIEKVRIFKYKGL